MKHFLLIYNHANHELIDDRVFADSESDAAIAAYQSAEQANENNVDIEIVLVGADSIDVVMKTHGHYFGNADRIDKYLTPTP